MLRRGLLLLIVVMVTLGFVAITRAAPVNHAVPTTPVVLTQFPTVVVVKSSANVRSGPGTEYAVISGARPGQRLSVVGCNADCSWYRLANDCWIAAFLVKPELPPAAPTVMVSIPITIPGQPTQCPQTNSPTTTYAGPGTFYPTVDMRPAGECVAIIGRNSAGDWYQLYRGMWIQSAAVVYADPLETMPITEPTATPTPTPLPTNTPIPGSQPPTPITLNNTSTGSNNSQPFTCTDGCAVATDSCNIKGNVNPSAGTRIYHVPGGRYYNNTDINPSEGDKWFCTEGEAQAAGFRPPEQ